MTCLVQAVVEVLAVVEVIAAQYRGCAMQSNYRIAAGRQHADDMLVDCQQLMTFNTSRSQKWQGGVQENKRQVVWSKYLGCC
jgi:hypothetical protein